MPSLPPAIAEDRLAHARIGRLATVTPAGRPHIVPVCFALHDRRIVTAVDAKPKATTELARLENVRATGRASLLVDHY
jgi:PPOX class probable F420-dependent enzyme